MSFLDNIEMTVFVVPDKNIEYFTDMKIEKNSFQFPVFIKRNLLHILKQWCYKKSLTPKLSMMLHRAAQKALNASRICTQPMEQMGNIMEKEGFITLYGRQQIAAVLGEENMEHFPFQDTQEFIMCTKF